MFDEQRFGNDGTEASRPCKPEGDNPQLPTRRKTTSFGLIPAYPWELVRW